MLAGCYYFSVGRVAIVSITNLSRIVRNRNRAAAANGNFDFSLTEVLIGDFPILIRLAFQEGPLPDYAGVLPVVISAMNFMVIRVLLTTVTGDHHRPTKGCPCRDGRGLGPFIRFRGTPPKNGGELVNCNTNRETST